MSNVAVFIENEQTADQGPTLACRTQTGASTNTVLTDSRGIATCDPVFGGTPNVTGTARLIVGGAITVDGAILGNTFFTRSFHIRSTPAAAGSMTIVSGSGQSATSGQSLANPLVVRVLSPTNTPLASQTVNWTVSPIGGAALTNTVTTTDANGLSSNQVRFPATVAGAVTITATLASDPTKTVTFTSTAVPVVQVIVTGLQIVSGNSQTAIVNTAFGAPLVVQVTASGGSPAGAAVTFSINGPGLLTSSSTVNTGADGRAQVTVQAGSTPGPLTVTASTAGFTQAFNLTVAPIGPTLLPSSFVNTADQGRGMLSPCSLATIIATGVAPGIQNMINGPMVGLLPGTVANTSVTVGGLGAPVSGVGRNPAGQEIVTFQVPCGVNPGSSVPVTVNVGGGNASVNIPILAASPGIFSTFGADGVNRAVVIRPEGSFVSAGNPARKGENLVALVTGLGASIPIVGSNSVAAPGSVTTPQGTVVVGMAGRGVPLISAQLSPDMIGVWLVTFTVPSDLPAGNATFSVSVIPTGSSTPISSGSAVIPVQ
jgi:uncharacterized protein (TIGR03437 family)